MQTGARSDCAGSAWTQGLRGPLTASLQSRQMRAGTLPPVTKPHTCGRPGLLCHLPGPPQCPRLASDLPQPRTWPSLPHPRDSLTSPLHPPPSAQPPSPGCNSHKVNPGSLFLKAQFSGLKCVPKVCTNHHCIFANWFHLAEQKLYLRETLSPLPRRSPCGPAPVAQHLPSVCEFLACGAAEKWGHRECPPGTGWVAEHNVLKVPGWCLCGSLLPGSAASQSTVCTDGAQDTLPQRPPVAFGYLKLKDLRKGRAGRTHCQVPGGVMGPDVRGAALCRPEATLVSRRRATERLPSGQVLSCSPRSPH
uniref:Uncharacterized protein n=1 Tax=Myotis myotis TaxID=51298 RepID=A0A7J7Z707_MYOMY|nr:hypothetical protein mMyoMyo1_010802 [Myotis myotis]